MGEWWVGKREISGGVLGWEKSDKWEGARLRKEWWMGECQVEKERINVSDREKRDKWESARLRKEDEEIKEVFQNYMM